MANILKNYGLCENESENNIHLTVQEAFDEIKIECDSTSIYFKRKWFPLEVLLNEKIGVKNKQIN